MCLFTYSIQFSKANFKTVFLLSIWNVNTWNRRIDFLTCSLNTWSNGLWLIRYDIGMFLECNRSDSFFNGIVLVIITNSYQTYWVSLSIYFVQFNYLRLCNVVVMTSAICLNQTFAWSMRNFLSKPSNWLFRLSMNITSLNQRIYSSNLSSLIKRRLMMVDYGHDYLLNTRKWTKKENVNSPMGMVADTIH